jgi:hypothetical protein
MVELSGTLAVNLRAAVTSAKRLRGHAVHIETLAFWEALLAHPRAQARASNEMDADEVESLMAELQTELSVRA